MVREGRVTAVDGQDIHIDVDTVCVHGDTSNAVELVERIKHGLELAGIAVVSLA